MIDILNENLPREKEITEGEMYDVGLYEEKVKRSIYGTRYIWIEDLADDEKVTNLLIDRIDEYICSEKYNSKKMFNINVKLLTLINNDSVYWRNDKILIYPDTDMLKTFNINYDNFDKTKEDYLKTSFTKNSDIDFQNEIINLI